MFGQWSDLKMATVDVWIIVRFEGGRSRCLDKVKNDFEGGHGSCSDDGQTNFCKTRSTSEDFQNLT